MVPLAALSLLSFLTGSYAGTTIWSGSFNYYTSVSVFDEWSWSNETGEYQWYIHGSQPTSHYLALDPSYKNPADTAETQGIRMTLDGTALWNGQTMERTELIPQTSQNLGTGELFYHFSISVGSTDPPNSSIEHQICFFESHFTELKFGVGPNATYLEWMVQEDPYWGAPLTAGTWFNFAYDINFSAGTVGLYASTGSDPLVRVVNNVAASTSTNSEDWHLGVLRLSEGTDVEEWYFSGVYIETGPITTSVGNGGSSPPPSSSSTSTTITTSTSQSSTKSPSTPTTTPLGPSGTTTSSPSGTTVPGPTQTHYGQCGGTGWTGPTTCASPYSCSAVSPPYYYQCL